MGSSGRSHPARGARTKCDGRNIFAGAEFGRIDAKEQRKIQIDIRRSIPAHKISSSPIRRGVEDPATVRVARRKGQAVDEACLIDVDFGILFQTRAKPASSTATRSSLGCPSTPRREASISSQWTAAVEGGAQKEGEAAKCTKTS